MGSIDHNRTALITLSLSGHHSSLAMKFTSTTTTTLLPFAPHQQPIPSSHPPQRASIHARASARVPVISSILSSMSTSASPLCVFDVPRRPNSLRIRPSTISETSYESSSSSASSSSSFFPNTSPTSCTTPSSSLPLTPPYVYSPFYISNFGNLTIMSVHALIAIVTQISPTSISFGKSRPLPKIPKSQSPPPIATSRLPLPSTAPPHRPRSPPPAWSPPESIPVSRRSPPPTPSTARPQRPKVMLPPPPPQRPSSTFLSPRAPSPRAYALPIDRSVTASRPASLRVRPLPMRPPPPGPPSDGDTPVAPFGQVRWMTDASTIPEDDDSSLCDDRRAIDWDLIDEVMMHAS
jgi:hypothetical protein